MHAMKTATQNQWGLGNRSLMPSKAGTRHTAALITFLFTI